MRRVTGRVAAAGLLVLLLIFVVAAVAAAQDACEGRGCPTTTTSPSPSTTIVAPVTSSTVPPTYVRPGEGVVPEIQLGGHPSGNYDLGYDEGAWNAANRKLIGGAMTSAFQAGRVLSDIGIFALHAVLSAPFELVFAPIVDGVGGALAVFTTDMRLLYYGLWLSIFVGALLFLRGRGITALSEIGFSLLALLIAGSLLGNIGGMYTGTARTIRSMSLLAVTATTPNPSSNPQQTVLDFDRSLHRAFVETPWLALNWGGPSKVAACGPAVDQALGEGPNDTDDRPRVLVATYGTKVDPDKVDTSSDTAQKVKGALGWAKAATLGAPGVAAKFLDRDGKEVDLADVKGPCAPAAAFNAKPTGDRAGGAIALALASGLIFALLVRVAIKQVFRGVIVALGFMTLPIAIGLLAFPGDARDSAFKHLAWIAKSAIHMVGSFLMLGVVIAATVGVTNYQVDPAVPGADIVGSMAFRFAVLACIGLAANIFLGKAMKAAGAAAVRGTARVGGAMKSSGRAPAFAAGAALGATGVVGAMAGGVNRAGTQVRNIKTLGTTVQAGASRLSSAGGKVLGAPLAAAKAPIAGAVWSARAAKGAAAKAAAYGQPMAAHGQLNAAGWSPSPDLAARAPVARRTMETVAVRAHAAAHGRPVKPTARIVARGDDGAPPRIHGPGQGGAYLYNESKQERHQLATYQDAVGGTLFPSKDAELAWRRRTEHRVARLTGQVGRPLGPADFDPAINHDRRNWAIARSERMHRQKAIDDARAARQRKRAKGA